MGTIKQDRKDLELLLNGIAPVNDVTIPNAVPSAAPTPDAKPVAPTAGCVDNTTGTNIGVQRAFDFDYEGTKKGLKKRARKTVNNIIKHILTDDMLDNEYIKDKMEQDIDTLADLYMQVESNNVMQRSILDTVSLGNTMPRLYEVFGQLTDKIQAINKQIINTEQTIRKTYIDLKYEIRDKVSESLESNTQNMLPGNSVGNSTLITSSKQLIEMVKKKHQDKLENFKETEYEEE